MRVSFRLMKYVDLNQCISINHNSMNENYDKKHWDEWFHKGKLSSFVATHNGNVAGYVLTTVSDLDATIMSFAVYEAFRNKGIGKMLLSSYLDKLKKKGSVFKYQGIK